MKTMIFILNTLDVLVNAVLQSLVYVKIKNSDCSTTETAESGVEEMEKSSFFSPATASQQSPISKEEETKRKSSLKTAVSSSFVDPFR